MKWRSLSGCVLFAWLVTATAHPAAQPLTAVLTYPADGATSADLSQSIRWTSVANVQAYYLYVGTTVGAKDLVNTGETQQTSYLAVNLPAQQTVYARLWTKAGGVWRYFDSTFSAAASNPQRATITYPADGATNVDLSQPIRWTAVPNAQAYYLYVGTTLGAKDLLNTGEIHQTSYQITSLPTADTVYVRLWTRVGGVWLSADSSFSAAPLVPSFVYPIPGATRLDLTQPWAWTSVPNAQAYYLYVGTTLGAKDLVNSGEIQQTSYLPATLPSGCVLYARLWAKVNGIWRSTDATFTVTPLAATLTYPVSGSTQVDLSQPIQWTTVANAQGYYLYVGSAPGANDFVNTGEIQQTSSLVTGTLPAQQVLYARIWAKVGGVWRYTDSTFSAAPLAATLTYPPDGGTNIDVTVPANWTTVAAAQAYYLYIGSTPGAKDVVDSGETQQTTYSISRLPFGQLLYARLWTKVAGHWRYVDATFSGAPVAPQFLYPLDGATAVDGGRLFQWTQSANAQAYYLYVGTTVGAKDLVNTGEIQQTSYLVTDTLPGQQTLYARIWAKVNGSWSRHSDIGFTLANQVLPSTIVVPADGTTAFDTMQPFQWTAVTLARGYRITIGTAPGANDLHDSGVIHVTQRFVPNLPMAVPLFGRLQTEIDGQWYATDFTFTVSGNTVSAAQQIASALWATDVVRNMAASDNRPYGWTGLLAAVSPQYNALCTDFAAMLLQVLAEMNVQTAVRRLDLAFGFDGHTLVELLNPATQAWMVLDPTFDLSVQQADGSWATAEAVSQATLAFNWSAIHYVSLGSADNAAMRNYYLDYPLLYVNVYHQGQSLVLGQSHAPLAYLQPVPLPATGSRDVYVIQCTGSGAAGIVIDGVTTQVTCGGVDSTSMAFYGSIVAPPEGSQPAFTLYRVPRFVF